MRLCAAGLLVVLCAAPAWAECRVRVLVVRHTPEAVAEYDASLFLGALQKAPALRVVVLGNYLIQHGSAKGMEEWLGKQIARQAEPGDTLLLFTVGHGHGTGTLSHLGRRADLYAGLVRLAEAHNQRVVWWQLSCHACAGLPEPAERVVVVPSSPATHLSASGIQGRVLAGALKALAEGTLDANGDGTVSAGELRAALNRHDGLRRGDLVRASSGKTPVLVGLPTATAPATARPRP